MGSFTTAKFEYMNKKNNKQILEKESKKQISAGVLLSYLVILVQFATGLLYTPVVLKTLGQSQYGVYSLCISFLGYLTIMNSGANAAYIRFYVQTKEKDPNRLSNLNGIFAKIFFLLAIISLFCGAIISNFSYDIFGDKINSEEYELVKLCLLFLSFTAAVQVVNCIFSSLVISNEKFIFAKTMNLIVVILNPLLTLPFLLNGYSCVSIVVVQLIMTLLSLGGNAYFCFKKLNAKFDFRYNDITLLKRILYFAGFIVLQSIMDQMNWQIDKFILARTHGTTEISLYSVGANFNNYYMTFSAALSSVFIAQINKLHARNDTDGINSLFIKSGRVFTYFVWLFMSAYIIFGKQFIVRWAGLEYEESYWIGMLIMLPVTASLMMGLAQDIARAMNKHHIQVLINFAICIVNVLISIPLSIKWGAKGAAIGTFLAEICMCVLIEPIYYRKVLGLNIWDLICKLGRIIPGIMIPLLYGFYLNFLGIIKTEYSSVLLLGLTYACVYFISMWLLAMNYSEKVIVKKCFNKIGNLIWSR